MTFLSHLRLIGRRFTTSETGSVPIEGVLASTFLIWWYIASFQFFDAYRQKNINLKAAYTLADMLSRETGPTADDPDATTIDQTYVNGLNSLFDYLTNSNRDTWVRVSSVYWDADDDKYRVDWSTTSGTGHDAMTTPTLQNYDSKVPVLPTGDTVIIVETFMAYEPMFNIGLDANLFTTFITTRPRFASCLPWEQNGCGTDNNGDWSNPDLTDLPANDPDET